MDTKESNKIKKQQKETKGMNQRRKTKERKKT